MTKITIAFHYQMLGGKKHLAYCVDAHKKHYRYKEIPTREIEEAFIVGLAEGIEISHNGIEVEFMEVVQ